MFLSTKLARQRCVDGSQTAAFHQDRNKASVHDWVAGSDENQRQSACQHNAIRLEEYLRDIEFLEHIGGHKSHAARH